MQQLGSSLFESQLTMVLLLFPHCSENVSKECVDICLVGAGLEVLHSHHIIHRDLKPGVLKFMNTSAHTHTHVCAILHGWTILHSWLTWVAFYWDRVTTVWMIDCTTIQSAAFFWLVPVHLVWQPTNIYHSQGFNVPFCGNWRFLWEWKWEMLSVFETTREKIT